jgi:hypothetical protein
MIDEDRTICAVCYQVECICTLYKCPCGRLEINCKWPVDKNCPCRVCDELQVNCSCHKTLEEENE